jgi:hypothetical protein
VVATRRLVEWLVGESVQPSWVGVGVDTADVAAGEVRLEGSDGAELVELLGFVRDWLGGPDSEALATSLARFVGGEGYDVAQLRADLVRFRFLLGGDDGHLLFGGGDD